MHEKWSLIPTHENEIHCKNKTVIDNHKTNPHYLFVLPLKFEEWLYIYTYTHTNFRQTGIFIECTF
jgi:hypothetical protein